MGKDLKENAGKTEKEVIAMARQTVAVFFGGQSSEHEISCLSAVNVIENIDREKYEVILVGITREGAWLLVDGVEAIRSGSWRDGAVRRRFHTWAAACWRLPSPWINFTRS